MNFQRAPTIVKVRMTPWPRRDPATPWRQKVNTPALPRFSRQPHEISGLCGGLFHGFTNRAQPGINMQSNCLYLCPVCSTAEWMEMIEMLPFQQSALQTNYRVEDFIKTTGRL